MQLKISAFGMIDHAAIDLDHLTVIAGHNDTGKSMIGRVLFSITQGMSAIPFTKVSSPEDMRAVAESINQIMESEFLGPVIQKNLAKDAVIELKDGASIILQMKISQEKGVELQKLAPWTIRDSTIIEGPLIFEFAPLITSFFDAHGMPRHGEGMPRIPYHSIDLARKLQAPSVASMEQKEKVYAEVQSIIDSFRSTPGYRSEKQPVGNKNLNVGGVASGVKVLSVINALAREGYIHKDTILIFDEPETSLHPEWQIGYAKVICTLADYGIKVLLTTHSPYMLEAIKEFSKNDAATKFYVSYQDKESGFVTYQDTMGDITPLINALSQPLYDLISTSDDEF